MHHPAPDAALRASRRPAVVGADPDRARSRGGRRGILGVLATGAVLALTACGSAAPEVPAPTVTAPAVIEPAKAQPPAPVVPPSWPLTGVAAQDVVARPALAVKIENPKEVRPQTGLDQADMVWEEVVEGGITRYVAVYHSVIPTEVGPIRSVRPMDPAIAAPLHGLIAFSGGQAPFVAALKSSGLQTVSNDAGDAGFYRTSSRRAPHNVFGTPQTFLDQADAQHQAPPPSQFLFARRADQATVTLTGAPASTLDLRLSGYARPSWSWNATDGTWLRSEAGTPATAASGARLAATNVVVVRVKLVDSGTIDPAGNPVPETVLVGSGEAVVATGGKTLTGTWSKASTDAPLALAAADGTPLKLAPGRTWVELVPASTGSVTLG